MSTMTPLERRVGWLIGAYADRALTGVDAVAMTELAAGSRRGQRAWGFVAPRGFALLLLVFALLATIAASALLAGAHFLPRNPDAVIATYLGRWEYAYVYEDGRVIARSRPDLGQLPGLGMYPGMIGERRLTPEGAEMVRSGSLDSVALLPGSDPMAREDLWADPSFHPFEPSTFAICYSTGGPWDEDPTSVVPMLPAPLQTILQGKERVFNVTRVVVDADVAEMSVSRECTELTIEESRALEEALDTIGRRQSRDEWFVSVARDGDASPVEIGLERQRILPQGGWTSYPYR